MLELALVRLVPVGLATPTTPSTAKSHSSHPAGHQIHVARSDCRRQRRHAELVHAELVVLHVAVHAAESALDRAKSICRWDRIGLLLHYVVTLTSGQRWLRWTCRFRCAGKGPA